MKHYASCSFNILHNTADDHKASITNETVNKENITFNLNNADGQTVTVYIAEYDNGTLVQAACENNMSITAETAKEHAHDPAVLCCRAEAGITIEPANLEDPAIFG